MGILEQMVLKHEIRIKARPEKIWNFFANLEKNYTTWHPQDHVLFKWTKGKPLQVGSTLYAEQYAMGKLTKYTGKCSEIIPYKKIVIKFGFPVSIVSPKIEWLLEPKGEYTVFTAKTYMRLGHLYEKLNKKEYDKLVASHDKHVSEEGENLKKILEK